MFSAGRASFGTTTRNRLRSIERPFLSFAEARARVRAIGLGSSREFIEWSQSGERPADIPAKPAQVYAGDGWAGYPDFLGYGLAPQTAVADYEGCSPPKSPRRRVFCDVRQSVMRTFIDMLAAGEGSEQFELKLLPGSFATAIFRPTKEPAASDAWSPLLIHSTWSLTNLLPCHPPRVPFGSGLLFGSAVEKILFFFPHSFLSEFNHREVYGDTSPRWIPLCRALPHELTTSTALVEALSLYAQTCGKLSDSEIRKQLFARGSDARRFSLESQLETFLRKECGLPVEHDFTEGGHARFSIRGVKLAIRCCHAYPNFLKSGYRVWLNHLAPVEPQKTASGSVHPRHGNTCDYQNAPHCVAALVYDLQAPSSMPAPSDRRSLGKDWEAALKGFFLFPKDYLQQRRTFAQNGHLGKVAMNVYLPTAVMTRRDGRRSRQEQSEYYIDLSEGARRHAAVAKLTRLLLLNNIEVIA